MGDSDVSFESDVQGEGEGKLEALKNQYFLLSSTFE